MKFNLAFYFCILLFGVSYVIGPLKKIHCDTYDKRITSIIELNTQRIYNFCISASLGEDCYKRVENFREEQGDALNTDLFELGCLNEKEKK